MLNFKSYFKTQPKVPIPSISSVPTVEPPRPTPIHRTGSIKINTNKLNNPQRTALPTASAPKLSPQLENDTIVASTPLPRQASISMEVIQPSISSVPKRPRTEDIPIQTPAKRPKVEFKTPSFVEHTPKKQRHRIVTLKTSNPKRLAAILGVPLPTSPLTNGRKPLPGSGTPNGHRDSISSAPAKIRKPLPTGNPPARKPLPGRSTPSASPPAPSRPPTESEPQTSPHPPSHATSPAPATPSISGAARTKIKIVRKPPPPTS